MPIIYTHKLVQSQIIQINEQLIIIATPSIEMGVGYQDRHGIFCLDVEYHHIISKV